MEDDIRDTVADNSDVDPVENSADEEEIVGVDEDTENETMMTKPAKSKKKLKEAGIIYLSRIPAYMSVKVIREMLGQYGEIGRLFLQPNEKASSKKKNRIFTEGWIEFTDKKVAKMIAASLNNKQVGGKRRSPWYEEMWNIKYLHRFKWEHLNERLAYERAVHSQRMRTEISQVKKETNFYIQNVERTERLKQMEKRGKQVPEKSDDRDWDFTQKETEEARALKRKAVDSADSDKKGKKKKNDVKKASLSSSLMQSIFSGGLDG